MTQTVIQDYYTARAADICLDDDGPGAPVHIRGADCAKVHGLRVVKRRCSVCELDWGEGIVSQHQRCQLVDSMGVRHYASMEIFLTDGSELIYEEA